KRRGVQVTRRRNEWLNHRCWVLGVGCWGDVAGGGLSRHLTPNTYHLKQRHSHAAFGTEFWPAFRLVAAARTGQLELNRAAAFRAELAAGGLGAARRASERRLRRAGAGAHVDARRVIGLLRFLIKLIACRIRHDLRTIG